MISKISVSVEKCGAQLLVSATANIKHGKQLPVKLCSSSTLSYATLFLRNFTGRFCLKVNGVGGVWDVQLPDLTE